MQTHSVMPMATSLRLSRFPDAPIIAPASVEMTNIPSNGANANSAAPAAPVNAMCPNAWAAKLTRRRITK